MYFMTWGRQNGDPQWDSINTFDKMNGRLRNAYVRFADSVQSCVAPVGVAWKYVRDNYPSINLYVSDGSHPSMEGTYLAACTFYASLFRKSPIGSTYTAGLNPVAVVALQNAAHFAVLDSLDTWHLRGNEDITIADFHYSVNGNSVTLYNDSWRSQNWSWSFGDGGTSQAFETTHNFASGGLYPVTLISSSECGDDTLTQYITIDILSTWDKTSQNFVIKTLEPGLFSIGNAVEGLNVQLCDLSGKLLDNGGVFSGDGSLTIDLRGHSKGIYCLSLNNLQGSSIVYLPVY
jgi:PKD repeat protein